MILRDDIFVVLMDFPAGRKVHEAVTENADGTYTIFIDSRLSEDGQQHEYEHAMKHIEDGDFEKPDVQIIEVVAHGQKVEKLQAKEAKKRWANYNRAMTRAYHRAERAAKALGMDYEDYIFARHDLELFRGY